MKDEALFESLYGTWTFVSESKADLGYYDALVYFVVHFMPDPLRKLGCSKANCSELDNHVCQDRSACVTTESNIVQWSDGTFIGVSSAEIHSSLLVAEKEVFYFFISFSVSAFYSFGIQVNTGFAWKGHIRQNTSDWLGPYNVIMAKDSIQPAGTSNSKEDYDSFYSSRLVQTATTGYLQAPPQCSIVTSKHFDLYAGLGAVQNSIRVQKGDVQLPSNTSNPYDPYATYSGTCSNGDLQPILPAFHIATKKISKDNKKEQDKKTIEFSLNYPILSIPESNKKDPLYKFWPTLQKRLKTSNMIHGPYCFENELKAYTMDASFHSGNASASGVSWKFSIGCLDGLPCWPSDGNSGNSSAAIPNSSSSWPADSNTSLLTYAFYVLLLSFFLSMTCNVQLLRKLKQSRRSLEEGAQRTPTPEQVARRLRRADPLEDQDLEECLLQCEQTLEETKEEETPGPEE